jgi:hypothetical protein
MSDFENTNFLHSIGPLIFCRAFFLLQHLSLHLQYHKVQENIIKF